MKINGLLTKSTVSLVSINMRNHNKLVFITPLYFPAAISGSQMFVKYLAEGLAQRGCNISVITSDALTPRYWYDPFFGRKLNSSYDKINGVSVYRLPSVQLLSSVLFILVRYIHFFPKNIRNKLKIISNGPYLLGLEKLLKKKKFDVIHCSPFPLEINQQAISCVHRLPYRPKLLITPFFHAQVPDYYNPEFQYIFDSADAIHVISSSEKMDISTSFRVEPQKIFVAPLFINTSTMLTQKELHQDIQRAKKRYGLFGRKIILFAGIKGRRKGALYVLWAVHELWRKDPSIVLIAIGSETTEWKMAKQEVDTGCLVDLPYKTGRDKEALFALSDVYCMPSVTETFGLTYLEAWHKKKPVIGADIPAVRELIVENAGGMTVPYADKNALQMAITKLIQNPVLSNELGENGYKALMKKYTLNRVLPKYLRFFNR